MKLTSMIAAIGFVYALSCTSVEGTTSFSRSMNDVGFSVTKRLGGNGNLLISPVSIYTTIAIMYSGSRGQTKDQILEGLNLRGRGVDTIDFYLNSKYIAKKFNGKQQGYSLSMANGLFAQEGFELREGFRRVVEDAYGGTLQNVDFAKKGQQAMMKINSWAAEKTANMIPNLLKDPLDPSTVMALLNALHFKGTWVKTFNSNDTKKGVFFNNSSRPGSYEAEFMEMRNVEFDYYLDPITRYKFLEMPYKGYETTMLIALPVDETQFPDLEMTEEILYRVTRKLRQQKFDKVTLPKFSFKSGFDLTKPLVDMGIKDLFSSKANLSGISENQQRLFVSSMFQQTSINVNEEGSEAAAVTGVVVTPMMARPQFIANHPFLFYILDFNSDIVLFSGRLVNP